MNHKILEAKYISTKARESDSHPSVIDLDRKIKNLKDVLNIETKKYVQQGIGVANPIGYRQAIMDSVINLDVYSTGYASKLNELEDLVKKYEAQLSSLPEKYLIFSKFQRDRVILSETYSLMKQKLEEAKIIPFGFFDLRRGAGAYICGEESAMIESIEGKRGLPRHRPPYVGQSGIFGKPTLVHNVETLYWVAKIIREGPQIFTKVKKNNRMGLRSFSVSGRVKNPGLYLLPSGSTILDIIEVSGGMVEGHKFKAYQPGGASSGLLPASICNVPLDFDTLNEFNTFIGSAAVVVLSDKDKIRDVALNMIEFFKSESCGQCTPCRVGCEKAASIMETRDWDISLLEDLCEVMESSSICGLGQAATNPIKSSIMYFSEEIKSNG